MKISVIGSKGLPPKQGGIEQHCKELFVRFARQGHHVDVFGRQSYLNTVKGQPFDYFGVQVIPMLNVPFRGLDAIISSALGALASCGRKYDITHFHAIGPALFCWLPKFFSSAKIVMTCQGLDWQRAKWGTFSTAVLKLGEWMAVKLADEIIVVSKDMYTYFLQTYGRETIYIPNGPAQYAASDATFAYARSLGLEPGRYIVFLGRLVPEKCPDLLIKAFKAISPADWKLVFVGGSSDTDNFAAHLVDLADNHPNILFAGQQSGALLAELVRGSGLFVLPSDLEGLPLAMLEAMNEGLPVLASDIPAHQQLLADDRGLLFEAGNLASCIQKLTWALEHPDARATMAQRGQQYIRQYYDWEDIAQQTMAVYKAAIGESTPQLVLPVGRHPVEVGRDL